MALGFNENSEKARFTYKHNPVDPKSFQIFENRRGYTDYSLAGHYTVLDLQEDRDLSEKKVMNLIALMNGRRALDLGHATGNRTLFQVLPKKIDSDPTKVIFRTHDGKGVSTENALFEIRRGVFYVH